MTYWTVEVVLQQLFSTRMPTSARVELGWNYYRIDLRCVLMMLYHEAQSLLFLSVMQQPHYMLAVASCLV